MGGQGHVGGLLANVVPMQCIALGAPSPKKGEAASFLFQHWSFKFT
jgi:hypothetical protein